MQIRLLDEAMDLGPRGVMLFCLEDAAPLTAGMRLIDARGNAHAVAAVTHQDEVLTLHVPGGSADYFGRLFRDVRIDATLFETEDIPCP